MVDFDARNDILLNQVSAPAIDINTVSGDIDVRAGGVITSTGNTVLTAGGTVGTFGPVFANTGGTLTVNATATGATGNITLEQQAAGRFLTSDLVLNTDAGSAQAVELFFPNGLTVDGNYGNALDSLIIHTPGGDIQQGAGTLTASALVLDSDNGIGGAAALKTATAALTASNATGGALNIDNVGAVTVSLLSTSSGDVKLNQTGGSGAVTITGPVTSGGQTLIAAASPLIVASNITSPGSIVLNAMGGGAADDLTINAGITVNATGAGSSVTLSGSDLFVRGTVVSNMSDVLANGTTLDMASAGVMRAAGMIDVTTSGIIGLGQLDAQSVNVFPAPQISSTPTVPRPTSSVVDRRVSLR